MMAETKNNKAFYNTEIPEDWKLIKLGEVFKLTSGKTKPNDLFNEPVDENIYPVYGGNGIMGFSSQFNSEGENILIGRVGEYCGITRFVNEKCWITDNALYTREFLRETDAKYLAYKLQIEDLSRLRNKGGQPLISQGPISIHKIILPKSLPEQRAIASVLSTWDEAIHKTEKLIAQKELRKKWLMQQLLTGKKRLNQNLQNDRINRIEMGNNSENHENSINSDSDNGQRLKGFGGEWKEYKLSDLFERVTRKNTEGNTTVVTISAQRGFVRQTDFFNKNIASEVTDNYFLVERGEFCYNKSYSNGYPWGATKRLNDFDKAVVTTLYICFGVKDEKKTNPVFFEQYFGANHLDKGLTKIAHEGGRAHGLLNVTPSDFFSLKVTVPTYDEQTAIAQVLQAADKEISLLKAKAGKLREQKKGLMQVLLTGKKRLNQNLQDDKINRIER